MRTTVVAALATVLTFQAGARDVASIWSALGVSGGLAVLAAVVGWVAWSLKLRTVSVRDWDTWALGVATVVVSWALYAALSGLVSDLFDQPAPTIPAEIEVSDFSGQKLKGATLVHDLRGTSFAGATLDGINLDSADLSEADFRGAKLNDTNLAGAALCAADLRGADLRGATNLDQVRDWRFTIYDERTKWPTGFDINEMEGPVPAFDGSLVYACDEISTKVLDLAGSV